MRPFLSLSCPFCKENDRNVQGLSLYQLDYSIILTLFGVCDLKKILAKMLY